MTTTSILHDLYGYDAWANQRLFALCDGLSDQQLDAPREMGFGTLRNTLFHILAAEEIWLERWQGKPWRPFEADSGGLSMSAIAARFDQVAAGRRALDFARELSRSIGWEIAVFSIQGITKGDDVLQSVRQDKPRLIVLPSSLPLSECASQLKCPVLFVP